TVSIFNSNVANNTSPTPTHTQQPTNYILSGTISPTAGGSGATVTLGGAASATTTANSSGAYTFSGLSNGTYTVTPSLAGYTYSPANASVTVNGANITGTKFTSSPQTTTYSIS